jgi:general secretion pathway protein B
MSLILDALNRAEQERKRQDQVPDIHTIHLSPAMALDARSRIKRRLWVAGGVGLFVLIGSGVWLMREPEAQGQVAVPAGFADVSRDTAPQAVVTEPQVVASPIESSQAVSTSQSTAQLPSPPVIAQTEIQPDSTTSNTDINNLYAASAEDNSAELAAPSPVSELYSEENTPESEAVETPFPELDAEPEPLPEVKSRSLDAFPNLPFFNDLPWTQKQQIPTISYSRHNYLPNAVSSVVINGATRGIGNLAPGEFIIEDIVSDGVVLRHRDKVFKLPALSGWVNM